ncbi:MAG: cytochrome C [Armatimonadetes bacterium]|nr:cytochrome C [Armatimonadota bacterium]
MAAVPAQQEEQESKTEAASGSRRRDREAEENKVLVWPDLVYIELIALGLMTAVLLLVSLVFNAPLEEIANPFKTPNPSKAPWYFLGLQEMLVYFDPWIAGVLLPTLIIVGLMAIPYVDRRPTQGSGYYNVRGREFAWIYFVSGFAFWFILIVIGTYLRGPGWAWYWPWEDQAHVKVVVENLRSHPHLDFLHFFAAPRLADGSVNPNGLDLLGVLLLGLYFYVGYRLPKKLRPQFCRDLGPMGYLIVMTFVLLALLLPVKMLMRLLLHYKYLLVTPWFNV